MNMGSSTHRSLLAERLVQAIYRGERAARKGTDVHSSTDKAVQTEWFTFIVMRSEPCL